MDGSRTRAALKEVGRRRALDLRDARALGRRVLELLDFVVHVLIHVHDGRLVAAAVAVVGGAEHGDDSALVLPQEALRNQLVRADDEAQPVDVVEVLANVLRCASAGAGAGRQM